MAVLNVFNVVISQKGLGRVNIPMFTSVTCGVIAIAVRALEIALCRTLRRLTVLFVMITQFLLNGIKPSGLVGGSVSLMILGERCARIMLYPDLSVLRFAGAMIGGWGDLTFDMRGYTYIILNNICTAVYLSLIKKVGC
jgi:hypothetical protein